MSGPLDFPGDERRERPHPAPEDPRERGAGRAHAPEREHVPARDRETAPATARASVPRPPGASRYGWLVGVVIVAVLAWITINTLRSEGISSTGVEPGTELPPFAAPLALGDVEGDVNVATEPDSGAAGAVPACEVRGPAILNSCELARRGPVVLGFLATRGGDCTAAFDALDAVRRGFPGVQVAVVSIRGDRGELRDLVRERGWGFPVAYDADGILANVYGVAVCPHLTFAYPGGEVRGNVLGTESEAELRGRFRRLVAASRERGWRPPRG